MLEQLQKNPNQTKTNPILTLGSSPTAFNGTALGKEGLSEMSAQTKKSYICTCNLQVAASITDAKMSQSHAIVQREEIF